MNLPHRRPKPLPERLLQTAAAGAGIARLAVKQRTIRPQLPQRKRSSRMGRVLRRG